MYAMYFVAVGSLAALLFAASMFAKVKKQPEGNSEMIRIPQLCVKVPMLI